MTSNIFYAEFIIAFESAATNMGQRNAMSQTDIDQLNTIYECGKHWSYVSLFPVLFILFFKNKITSPSRWIRNPLLGFLEEKNINS